MVEKSNEEKIIMKSEDSVDRERVDDIRYNLLWCGSSFLSGFISWWGSSVLSALISNLLHEQFSKLFPEFNAANFDKKEEYLNLAKSYILSFTSFVFYSRADIDAMKLIISIFPDLGIEFPKTYLEKDVKINLDENNKDLYIAKSLHVVETMIVSHLLTITFSYFRKLMPGQVLPNYARVFLDLGTSVFMALSAQSYFDPKYELKDAIKTNNYPKVDAIIKYRMPQDKIADVIDILSQNIKCREMKAWHCNSAIEASIKLIDRSMYTEYINKSIKFAVSLALSVGEGSKISDEVLNKIKGSEVFSEIINIAKDYLNADKYISKGYPNEDRDYLKIKDEAINGLLRSSNKVSQELILNLIEVLLPICKANEISNEVLNKIEGSEAFSEIIDVIKGYLNGDKYYLKIKDEAINFLLKISDKIPKKLIVNLIEILLPICKASEISDEVLNKIKGSEVFSEIIDKISSVIRIDISEKTISSAIDLVYRVSEINEWSYTTSNGEGENALNNIVQYLLKLDELGLNYPEQTKKLHCYINNMLSKCHTSDCSIKGIDLMVSAGKANEISDEVLNQIKGSEVFSEIINIAKDYLNADKYISKGYPNEDRDYLKIKDEAINFLLRISDKASTWHSLSNKIIEIASDVLIRNDVKKMNYDNVEILSPTCTVNEESCKEIANIEDLKLSSGIIEKQYDALEQSYLIKISDSMVELIDKITKTIGWMYIPSNENGGNALNNIVQYLLKLDELGLRYPEQVKKLHDSINNILNKCVDNDSLFKGVEILLSSGKLNPISDMTISNIGNVDLYRKILEKLTTYDESKSTSNVINEFASSLLSNCGEKCIGHAMELFYKNGGFNKQIEPFEKEFDIAKIINKFLDDVDDKLLIHILRSEEKDSASNKALSLEKSIFKYLVSDVESTKQTKIPLDTDCIYHVQDKFHKAFHGEIYPNSNFLGDLAQDIYHCYDGNTEASSAEEVA